SPEPRSHGGWAVLAWAVATVLAAVVALGVVAQEALTTRSGQELDQSAMESVYAREDAVGQLLSVLGYISIGTTALALLVCVGLALVRHRYAAAGAAVTVVAGANVTTQALKNYVLDRPDFGNLTLNSLPSGHTTVVTSIVLAALLVAPRSLRLAVAGLGTGAVTFTGASTIVAGWHRPSDVLAALAVSLAWGSAAVVALTVRRRAGFSRDGVAVSTVSLLGTLVAGAVLVVLGVRPLGGWTGFGDAAVVLGVVGLACSVVVAWFARLASVHAA
ncbi:phosphatase PAP2 family protein, partial [Solicola sp. PLA-1-18]|uniref:phosphatase PAP2 family protein n=1 Tax=Solicola sp. PLA-1-18 TaxID=3380532 RepID=UPI003B76AB55